jgi:ribose transport system ATP-binding protein
MAQGVNFVSSRRAEGRRLKPRRAREHLFEPGGERRVLDLPPVRRSSAKLGPPLKRFSIKTAGLEEPVATLSGGNQQKVVLARWMEAHVKLLILEGRRSASTSARRRTSTTCFNRRCARAGVLLISSDFEEVSASAIARLCSAAGRSLPKFRAMRSPSPY